MDRPDQTRLKRARGGRLIAIDGIDGAAVAASARRVLATIERSLRGGVSRWDASGIFDELRTGDRSAGILSARTLLLLYAADLAFRLRWELRPALAAGRAVVAAPYVDTAVAFGRAAGIPASWLSNLFLFAPRPSERRVVLLSTVRHALERDDFVAFACHRWAAATGAKRRQIAAAAADHLRAATRGRPERRRKNR
jgi:thymidylate kinase